MPKPSKKRLGEDWKRKDYIPILLKKIWDLIKRFPFPFEVEATDKSNADDVRRAIIVRDLLEWEWENSGGRKRFFRELSRKWANGILRDFKPLGKKLAKEQKRYAKPRRK